MQRRMQYTVTVLVAIGLCASATCCWAGRAEGALALERGDYATALREFRLLAEQGDTVALSLLGDMYTQGWGVPQDYTQAAQWYRRAADQGDAGAQMILGHMYTQGWGVPQDYTQAMQWYRRAADQGDADAQKSLGDMYVLGRDVPQDFAQAAQWYRRAADQGNARAQTQLGGLYDSGRGVPQDYTQAMQWYRRAAEQGSAEGQYNLGTLYTQGRGLPQDYAQAYGWFDLAAAHLPPGANREKAIRARDLLAARLTPAQLADVQARTRTWQPKPETPSSSSAPFPGLAVPVRGVSPRASPPAPLRRDLIRTVQERLHAAGFPPGTIDGTLGPQTRQALRRFQNVQGLRITGDLDEPTLSVLGIR
jgi:TPR repeat protein